MLTLPEMQVLRIEVEFMQSVARVNSLEVQWISHVYFTSKAKTTKIRPFTIRFK